MIVEYIHSVVTENNIHAKRVVCKDGFRMSVQAGPGNYCKPRPSYEEDKKFINYTEVEIGFPSEQEDLIMEYCEDPSIPTDTVYGYVPVEVVEQVIRKHGGLEPSLFLEFIIKNKRRQCKQ
jgi:hypothetical protein